MGTKSPSEDSYKNDLWGAGTSTAAYSTQNETAPAAAYDFGSRPAESNMFNNDVGEGADMFATPGEEIIGPSGYEADYNITSGDVATGGNDMNTSIQPGTNDNPFDDLGPIVVPPADLDDNVPGMLPGDGAFATFNNTSTANGTTAGGPSTYVVPGYEDDYADGYEDVYGRRDTISAVGGGMTMGSGGGGNVNYNIKNWDSWSEQQVSSWVENKLLNELNFDSKEVAEFMKSFVKEGLNGDKLRKFKDDDNNRFVNDLQSRLDNAFLASLYTDVQMAVMELP